MKRSELAKLLEVDIKTLGNWEKNKPELIRLINQGLLMDNQIEEAEKTLNKLKSLKEKSTSGKLELK